MSKIHPPWTSLQVDALNRFQQLGDMHPFTCPNHTDDIDRRLIATVNGWICPHCDYTQKWAHDFMEDPI